MSAKVLNDGFTEYLKKLEVTQDIKDLLEEARLKVKDALKKGIVKETLKKGNAVSPRFMRQGSAGYRTQNMPLNPPKQQVDFDYGCYLPLSYHKDGAEPEDAADDFFDMVDSILSPLAKQNDWTAKKGKKSYSLVLREDVHFDVPLYSVPDDEYKRIRDMRPANESVATGMFSDGADHEEPDATWDELPTKSIMLAYFDESGHYKWRASDPRKLNVYFMGKSDENRAIYRILKGWRDYNWQDGKAPSSIFMMSLAEAANERYEKTGFFSNIEEELVEVLKFIATTTLPIKESKVSVKNPADANDGIKCDADVYRKLKQHASGFTDALKAWCPLQNRCKRVVAHLGDRFPVIEENRTTNTIAPKPTSRAG